MRTQWPNSCPRVGKRNGFRHLGQPARLAWMCLAWLSDYARHNQMDGEINQIGGMFWRRDFPRGRELLQAWWQINRTQAWVCRSLIRAYVTKQDIAHRPLAMTGWNRTRLLAALLVVCLPRRSRTESHPEASKLVLDGSASLYLPGDVWSETLAIDFRRLTWTVVYEEHPFL